METKSTHHLPQKSTNKDCGQSRKAVKLNGGNGQLPNTQGFVLGPSSKPEQIYNTEFFGSLTKK